MALVLHEAIGAPDHPVCTVCIANFNGEHLLPDCIDSVRMQLGGIPCEILVHDDASTDASVSLLRTRYPDVAIIASDTNVGFCVGNNRMAERARGKHLLLLNNDAALFPDALYTLQEEARVVDAPAILTLPQYDWSSGELVDRGCLLDAFYNPVPNLDERRSEVAYAIGACLWIPRATWEHLGGFPDWMGSIAEDIYLCCQARLRGIPVRAVNGSGFRHRLGSSFGGARIEQRSLRTTMRRRRLSERNKTYCMAVFTPLWAAMALIPLHLAALMLEGLFLALRKRQPALLREVYLQPPIALLREHTRLREQRRLTLACRRVSWRTFYRPFTWFPRKLKLFLRYGVPEIR